MCAEDKKSTSQNAGQWLQHTVEVETKFKYHEKTQADHQASLKAILDDPNNNVNRKEDLHVVVTLLGDNEAFDFDSIHHLELPLDVERFPLVVMMIYKKNEDKCFAKIKADLTMYDGVTSLHTVFNMLEHLEYGTCSPFPHTGKNPMPTESQYQNFTKQLSRMYWAKIRAKLSLGYWLGRWQRSPFMGNLESRLSDRPGLRFTEVTVPFKTIMNKIEQTKELLDIPFYSITVNYSPSIGLAFCPNLETDKAKIADSITFPPVGTGCPPPMDANQVAALFNTIFVNNYGKHEAPRISGKVVGLTWDWVGMMKSFPPFFFIAQVQGKLFFTMSAAPADFELIAKSGIFDDVGKSTPFRHREAYV